MAKLIEAEGWPEDLYCIELTDPVVGGQDGIDNIQAKQLGGRTQYLKKELATVSESVAEIKKVVAGVAEEVNQGGGKALETHDGSASAHSVLVRQITAGGTSPVIGVCQLETGNVSGLHFNCDGEGQPITPNKQFFDYHPVYAGMKTVLIDGQIMVEIPPFYIKTLRPATGPFAGKLCKIISPTPAEGFRPHPAFLNQFGDVLPTYVGAYQGSDDGGKMCSRPGKMPLVSLDFPAMQARAAARNVNGVSGFRMWDYFQYSALCLLFLIEHSTTDSQRILGRGIADDTKAGLTDDYRQPVWRGLVGLYGNVWQMVEGMRLDATRGIELWKEDGSRVFAATGKQAPPYNGSTGQYVVTCHDGESNGFHLDDYFLPATQNATYENGSFSDWFWGGYGSAGNVLYVGVLWNYGSGAGLFCADLGNTASNLHTHIGCRLAK